MSLGTWPIERSSEQIRKGPPASLCQLDSRIYSSKEKSPRFRKKNITNTFFRSAREFSITDKSFQRGISGVRKPSISIEKKYKTEVWVVDFYTLL